MELKHDWKAFNAVLFPSFGRAHQDTDHTKTTMAVLVENERIIEGLVSNGVAFDDQGGNSPIASKDRLDGLSSKYATTETVVLNNKNLLEGIFEASRCGSNYYQQLATLRTHLLGAAVNKTTGRGPTVLVSRPHFVIDFLQGAVARLLPRNYNFLIFVDESESVGNLQYRALLLQINQGKVDQFFEPDFSSLHQDRLEDWQKQRDLIGEYLESRYILPCYGIFLKKSVWVRCLQSEMLGKKPWRSFAKAEAQGAAAVFPQTTLTKTLLAAQRIILYFGRD